MFRGFFSHFSCFQFLGEYDERRRQWELDVVGRSRKEQKSANEKTTYGIRFAYIFLLVFFLRKNVNTRVFLEKSSPRRA